ncbi:MAG: NAD(P)H-hydrate dehydratase [Clostridia bacterium]|nr:NAD(P)H-hydrate dehydratase [Clostridia bacterium]
MIKSLSQTTYKTLIKSRRNKTYKGDFGVAGLVCGSVSYQGAATYAASAALHTGAGIVCAFIPKDIYLPFASKISGAVIEPLDSVDGKICDSTLTSKIIKRKCTAVLCGSGLGISDSSAKTTFSVLSLDLPVVLDGDALSAISTDKSVLDRNGITVLTPHIGEFAKLCDKTPSEVRNHRVSYALEFSEKYNCTVVLKDYVTVIADKGKNAFVFSNPVSSLSKGGSGDVLAGMVTSFLSQGYSSVDACSIAVTLHNACGIMCDKRYGSYYTQPENIIECISELIK